MRLTEADLKSAVTDYLQYQMNLGKLWFTRLNSGEAFVKKGSKFHKIQLCPEGTSDFIVIKKWKVGVFCEVFFLELKTIKGRQRPAQKAFQIIVEKQQGNYFIIRSVEELEEILN